MKRRQFLKLSFYLSLSSNSIFSNALTISKGSPNDKAYALTSFVEIDTQGVVTLFINQQEMGQGVRTSIAQLLCEELEYPIEKVRLLQAPAHPDKYGRQLTGGSGAMRRSWGAMRKAGAAAKEMLLQAAAKKFQVELTQLRAKNGEVIIGHNGKRIPYGELVSIASTLPVPSNPSLKKAASFNYIGKNINNLDNVDLVTGKMIFGTDFKLPGMRHASLIRSPTLRGKVKSVEKTGAKEIDFYVQPPLSLQEDMPQTREAVVILANSSWQAIAARKHLDIDWIPGAIHHKNSRAVKDKLLEISAQPGVMVRREGDLLSDENTDITAQYYTPMQYQAQMEPMVCTALFDNGRCQVWAPVQWPHFAQRSVAAFLKIDLNHVVINPLRMGGSFGRKYCDDFIIECVAIAYKYPGTPIQTLWTREDDITCGGPQIACAHQMAAKLDNQNRITHWRHRLCQASPTVTKPSKDDWQPEQGQTPLPYDFDNVQCEFNVCPADMDTTAHRAVFYPTNAFAINVFIDEVAHKLDIDTPDYHQYMLSKKSELVFADWMQGLPPHLVFSPERLSGALNRVIKMAGVKSKSFGRGFALQRAMFSYVAAIIDVSFEHNVLQIEKVHVAVDCGTLINPNNARAQVEGSIIWGLSTALSEELTMKEGIVEQKNYDSYSVMRSHQAPEMVIEFIDSDYDPTGIGEPVVTVMAPALVNAIFAITGKRIRHLPILSTAPELA